MRRALLVSCVSMWTLAACVDPASLSGFECDDAGHCKPPSGGTTGGGTDTGGGSATGGGTATGGGASDGGGGGTTGGGSGATGGGGGATPCNATSCTGCCGDDGQCHAGNTADACGQGGQGCSACAMGTACQAFVCQPLTANGGRCGGGTECASGFCVSGFCCNAGCTGACETCAAMGTEGRCTPLAEATVVSACGAYACDGVSGSCPTSCTSSRQCAAGRFCDNGRCEALRMQGVACTASSQCQSGFCADGVCCDGACSGSCDRCNLAGQGGACRPAPSGDPGAPACGTTVTCNGTLVDCPILCSSGCPTGTYCSGTYCSAKKANGVVCGGGTECQSGNCADGVCCNTACAGACDACSVAQGAAVDGTCGLLGPSRVCRAPSGACDVEERCDGVNAACPANGFADAGVGCGTTTYSAWSTCTGSTACATTGTQTRTRTELTCNGTGTCGSGTASESQSCTQATDGLSCGTTTYSAYTACNYASSCSTTGTRTRTRTDPICATGTCSAVQSTETDLVGCNRATENVSCGSSTYGAYGPCSYGSTCAQTGSRTRTRTDPVCQSGACGATTASEMDTTGCARTTTGQSCGTTNTTAWGSCSYGSTCATTGTRTRQVTTYACGSGACNANTVTESDMTACGRTTQGTSCSATQYGPWSACSYANACSNTGSRTRSVTTYSCDGTGGCAPNTTTETDMVGCARAMDGQSCGTPVYGAYTTCSYGSTCTNSGERTRSVTSYVCGGGSCGTMMGTDRDTAGCARSTDGTVCATAQCGACRCPACERTCTVWQCNAGNCESSQDFLGCSCSGACAVRAPDPEQ